MPKKKIKEIFIGSNNQGKLREISDLLPKKLKIFDHSLVSKIEKNNNSYIIRTSEGSVNTKKIV